MYIGVVVVVVLIGGWLALSNNETNDVMQKDAANMEAKDTAMMEKTSDVMEKTDADAMLEKSDTAMIKDEGALMQNDEAMMTARGSYEIYAPEKLAKASSGDVVLFFKAGWCPTCRTVDADIKAHMKDIPSNLTILEVNYDNSADLKKKYGVTYQHTFVQVDAQGALIKKWSSSPSLTAIVSEVK